MVEQYDLILELQASVVSPKKFMILLLQLLPHQLSEAWLDLELLL